MYLQIAVMITTMVMDFAGEILSPGKLPRGFRLSIYKTSGRSLRAPGHN
jgi:hypothetical protein